MYTYNNDHSRSASDQSNIIGKTSYVILTGSRDQNSEPFGTSSKNSINSGDIDLNSTMKEGQPNDLPIATNVKTFYDEICPSDQENCFKLGCTESCGSGELCVNQDTNSQKTIQVITSLREMTSNYTDQSHDMVGTPKSVQVSLEQMLSNSHDSQIRPPDRMETSTQLINSELVKNRVNSSQYSKHELTETEKESSSVKKNQSYVVTAASKLNTETEYLMKKHFQIDMEQDSDENSLCSKHLCDPLKNTKMDQVKPQKNCMQSSQEQRFSEEKAQADLKMTMCKCASLTQVTLWKLKESSQKLHSLLKEFDPMTKMIANRKIKNGSVNTGTNSPTEDMYLQEHDSPTKDVSSPNHDSRSKDSNSPRHASATKDVSSPNHDSRSKDSNSPRHASATKDVSSPNHDSRSKDSNSPRHASATKDVSSPNHDSRSKDSNSPRHASATKDVCCPKHYRSNDSYSPRYDSAAKDTYSPRNDSPTNDLHSPRHDSATKDIHSPGHDSPKKYVCSPRPDSLSVSSTGCGSPTKNMYSARYDSPKKDFSSPIIDSSKKDVYSPKRDSLPTKELYSAKYKVADVNNKYRMSYKNESTEMSKCCFCLNRTSEVYVLDHGSGSGLATGNKNPNDTCTVYKKITRKCRCIVEKSTGETYNELVRKFNETDQQSSNPLGEIIRNIKILKKYISTGTTNAKIALNFLLQGLKESSESEQNDIVEGCVYADVCDIFEDSTIISKCILCACFSHDDAALQELAAEFIYNLGNYEEGKRYLNMNSNILNDIQKIFKSPVFNRNEKMKEYLVGTIAFMESNEDTLAKLVEDRILQDIVHSLMRNHKSMELEQLHRNLVLVQKMSSIEKGQEILLKDFKNVSLVIKDLLDHYSDCGVNSCVTSILSNILSSGACERNALCKKCAGLVEQKVAATSCLKIRNCNDKCVESKRTCSRVKFGETLSACINICLGEEEELLSELSDRAYYGNDNIEETKKDNQPIENKKQDNEITLCNCPLYCRKCYAENNASENKRKKFKPEGKKSQKNIADLSSPISGISEDKHFRKSDASEKKSKNSKNEGIKSPKSASDKKSKNSRTEENHSNKSSAAAPKVATEQVYGGHHAHPCPSHHLNIKKNLDQELHNCVFVINKQPEEKIT